MKTKVTEQGVQINYGPFIQHFYRWEHIEKAEVVDYGFIGGWGIRYSFRYGWAYNVKGTKGLALEFKDGAKRLVGTQQPAELRAAIEEARN